ncbi:MAG: FAD:protein FMN transferase [Candidatus Diapherotrites archaeon]
MKIISEKIEVLGTIVEIKLTQQKSYLVKNCFNEFKRIEEKYSRFKKNSLLSKANAKIGVWQKVDSEFIFLLKQALYFNNKTNGFFDVTIKKILENLGYDQNYSLEPKIVVEKEIEGLEEPIIINEQTNEILLHKEIDFGGLGKGYAIDLASLILKKNLAEHYYINAGGDVFAKSKYGFEPWIVLLEHPDKEGFVIGKIELNGKAIACSAPNKRKWLNYHHLINPKKKMPEKENKAVFVLADSAIEADAYATGLFCAGFENAIEISKKLPIGILLISSENKIYKSKNFDVNFFE